MTSRGRRNRRADADEGNVRERRGRDTARLFMHGRSQAVRLPLAYRMPGDRVRIRRVKEGVLLEPMAVDLEAMFAEMDRLKDPSFMRGGRDQPPAPDEPVKLD